MTPCCLVNDGFVVLRDVLEGRAVEAARRHVAEVVAERRPGGCERPNNTLVPMRWNDAVVGLLLGSASPMERVRSCTDASDLKWISGYVSVRPPRTGPLEWHQDWWCWNHAVALGASAPQVAVLFYLDDVSVDNAALRVLAGSHRHSTALHRALAGRVSGSEDVEPDVPDAITLPVRAGDAVVIDYRLLHATTPNTTRQQRTVVLLSFAPRWKELPADVRGHLIAHLALPRPDEHVPRSCRHASLLPTFDGPRIDLELNRRPPDHFAIA